MLIFLKTLTLKTIIKISKFLMILKMVIELFAKKVSTFLLLTFTKDLCDRKFTKMM